MVREIAPESLSLDLPYGRLLVLQGKPAAGKVSAQSELKLWNLIGGGLAEKLKVSLAGR